MLNRLLFASLPILSCHATYLDPSLQQQKPLVPGSVPITPSDILVLPLSLDANLSYTFPSTSHDHHHPTTLHRLQNTAAIHATHHEHHTITLSIPISPTDPGTVSFSAANPASPPPPPHPPMTWIPQNPWDATMHHIPLTTAGLHKGGTLSLSASSASLDLSTPFITLPKSLWDVVVLATQPEPHNGILRVSCASITRFPDLVLHMLVDAEGEEAESEFVVAPEQYVLQRGRGECLLLVKEAESAGGEAHVGLGWAAARGRQVVFDWEEGRMGFGEVKA